MMHSDDSIPHDLRRSTRVFISVLAVGLAWALGIFYVPPSWRPAIYSQELKIISYSLLATFFAVYALGVTRFRWWTICFGLFAGYVAGAIGDALAAIIFDYQRVMDVGARHPWEALASSLLFSIVLGVWLGGLCAGALTVILQSAVRRFV